MPWGIRTCLDLARADRRLVRSLLTATGEALWWELNGEPVQPIQPRRPPHKVLSRGGSLGESTADPIVLYAWLVRHLERLIEELDYHEVRAGRLTVWVGYRNGHVGRRPDDARGPQRPLRPAAGRGPPLPAPGVDPRVAGDADAPDRRAADAAGRAPAGPVRAPRRAGRGRRPAQAATVNDRARPVRPPERRHALPLAAIYGDPANGYDICDVRGKMCF